jgi:hypothetical protein
MFPRLSDIDCDWALNRYGQSSTSRFDLSLVIAVREVSDVGQVGWFVVRLYSKQFPPSVAKTKHGWGSAPHLEGRNEVENRNSLWRLILVRYDEIA